MVIKSGFNVEDYVRDDRIHGRVYTDPDIFEMEMDRIFGHCWVYVAHETEIPEPGDYRATTVGLQPVIVTRDADQGAIHVPYNRCRHRAATVCQDERGNANYFRCAYHGWTYNNQGELIGVPYRQGYGESFTYAEFGLVPVARVDSYKGFIFANLSPDGPSLQEHLGNAMPYLDQIAAQGTNGIYFRGGVHKYGYDGNWKLQLENSVDNYHAGFVHKSFFDIVARRPGGVQVKVSGNPLWRARDLGNGHGLLDFGTDTTARQQRDKVGGNLGDLTFNLTVFPNLAFVGMQARVIRPISPVRTEIDLHPALLVDAPEEVNYRRLRGHEQFFGPAGFGGPDDVEVAMGRVQDGLKAKGNEWLILKRGLSHEEIDERGVRSGLITDEMPQQAVYRMWRRVMAEG
jgi:phenylpropionate dioxygenase-like ring-hydroxylating dioxygenase large terminal subunit